MIAHLINQIKQDNIKFIKEDDFYRSSKIICTLIAIGISNKKSSIYIYESSNDTNIVIDNLYLINNICFRSLTVTYYTNGRVEVVFSEKY